MAASVGGKYNNFKFLQMPFSISLNQALINDSYYLTENTVGGVEIEKDGSTLKRQA